MKVQKESEGRSGELPESEAAPEGSHRIEEGGPPGHKSKEQIEQSLAQAPEPPPGRAQQVIDKTERQAQDKSADQLQELHTRVERHLQPKSRDQRPPERAGSS